MSNAIYLWEFAVALGIKANDFGDAEQIAYQLYHKYKYAESGQGTALQQWIDDVVNIVSQTQYADHFNESLITEAKRLQTQLYKSPQSALELDMLLSFGGGDSLDRVMYEGVKKHLLGIYDPRYPLWSNVIDQLPMYGIDRILATLPQLSTDIQHICLENLEVPRNNRAAIELIHKWFSHHPVVKEFTLTIEKGDGYHQSFFKREVDCYLQIFRISFYEKSYIQPMVNFFVDLKDHFLTQEQQQDETLLRKFHYQFYCRSFFYNYGTSNQKLIFRNLINRWDSVVEIEKSLEDLNKFIDYTLEYLSTPEKINHYYNHRTDKEVTFDHNNNYSYLNIAATLQDPILPEIYQKLYDAIPVENEQARVKLEKYYQNDIVEIQNIVSKKDS